MALLDSLLSGMMGQAQGGQAAANPLLDIMMQLLSAQGGAGVHGGGQGGLGALIEQFQHAGLGQQMNSWIGTGQNLPISPDQLMQALGQGRMQEMASSSGMDLGQLSGGLSEFLPKMIDGLTPSGQIPAGGIDSALAELSRMLPRQA
jgi:uncharacterized protein YidB (DUF937 family)